MLHGEGPHTVMRSLGSKSPPLWIAEVDEEGEEAHAESELGCVFWSWCDL